MLFDEGRIVVTLLILAVVVKVGAVVRMHADLTAGIRLGGHNYRGAAKTVLSGKV